MKLDDLLGLRELSSGSIQEEMLEQSIKSSDRRQIIEYDIKLKLKCKLEELLGKRLEESKNDSAKMP